MISIHTFELTKEVKSKCFNNLLSSAYKKAKKHKNRIGHSTKHTTGDVRIDDRFSSDGITIEYHNYEFRKMIKLCINPSKLLGGNDLNLWRPDTYNTELVLDRISECIEDYFDENYDINDFTLTRVDFTVNLNVGKKNVKPYIALFHKLGKVKKFEYKYGKADYKTGRIDKEDSFDLKGKTNLIEFTAYNKEADLKKKDKYDKAEKAKGILRLEVRLTKRKAVIDALENLTKCTDLTTEEEFDIIVGGCSKIFTTWMAAIIPYGDSYKIKKAIETVEKSDIKMKRKEKMIALIKLIPKKKSLYLAAKELKLRDLNEVLCWFAKIGVSPITISKREQIDYLKNLYDMILA